MSSKTLFRDKQEEILLRKAKKDEIDLQELRHAIKASRNGHKGNWDTLDGEDLSNPHVTSRTHQRNGIVYVPGDEHLSRAQSRWEGQRVILAPTDERYEAERNAEFDEMVRENASQHGINQSDPMVPGEFANNPRIITKNGRKR